MKLNEFTGKLWFCSNFYPIIIEMDGVQYRTLEHAYQAAKTLNPKLREHIRKQHTPGLARKQGQKIPLRSGWDQMKLEVMEGLLRQKFAPGFGLWPKLNATGDMHLEEKNHHGDTFWGTVDDFGTNHLGKLLMKIRAENRETILQASMAKVSEVGTLK